jgi:hypothetical protein
MAVFISFIRLTLIWFDNIIILWKGNYRRRKINFSRFHQISDHIHDAGSIAHHGILATLRNAKGSRKNKFTFSGVEASSWQGIDAQEYRDISALRQHRQAECIGA